MDAEEKKFGGKDRWLRARIENEILKLNGVDRAAHHGGDFTGRSVKNMMANVDVIFQELENLLLEIADEKEIKIDAAIKTFLNLG